MKKENIPVHKPKTERDYRELHSQLTSRGFMAIDALKPGKVRDITSMLNDAAEAGAQDMAKTLGGGGWCTGPICNVAWGFDNKDKGVNNVPGEDGKPLGLGYVKWGAGDNIPSTIPPLAMALPYTAAPLRYIADTTAGLGVRLMYRFPNGDMVEFRDAEERLRQEAEAERQAEEEKNTYHGVRLLQRQQTTDNVNDNVNVNGQTSNISHQTSDISPQTSPKQAAYEDWKRTWYGEDVEETNADGTKSMTHIPGAKEFLDNNNLDLHLMQCEQDDVMLDIYFPTVGLQRGRRGAWDPRIVSVSLLAAHSCRLERMNEYRHINHVYYSDIWRTKGVGSVSVSGDVNDNKYVLYPAAMPQNRLQDLRHIVESNQRTRIKDRPTWIVCPTFYPSLNKPYYPQPAWWSVFTSKAFDFSSTILYDKAKQRENVTSWGKILYVSLDYLDQIFADEGYQGDKKKQDEFLEELEQNMENFLQHRENHGKMMRQWMWEGKDGKEHHNIEIVDVAETTRDAVTAGKEELELSTSPIFLALQVDPRLVGVPMVHSSNGGTALREMHLIKQQQLNVKQRLLLGFYNDIVRFNRWSERAEFIVKQQTLTTLDNSKTGTVETISGEGA